MSDIVSVAEANARLDEIIETMQRADPAPEGLLDEYVRLGKISMDDAKRKQLDAVRAAVMFRRGVLEPVGDYLILFGSHERPREFLRLTLGSLLEPRAKWQLLHREWSGFDRIPHGEFSTLLAGIRPAWNARYMLAADHRGYSRLADTITVHRGQDDAAPVGLSWTTDRAVAERFARGHRFIWNPHPVLLTGSVSKRDVAGFYTDRKESEVVVFEPGAVEITQRERVEAHA